MWRYWGPHRLPSYPSSSPNTYLVSSQWWITSCYSVIWFMIIFNTSLFPILNNNVSCIGSRLHSLSILHCSSDVWRVRSAWLSEEAVGDVFVGGVDCRQLLLRQSRRQSSKPLHRRQNHRAPHDHHRWSHQSGYNLIKGTFTRARLLAYLVTPLESACLTLIFSFPLPPLFPISCVLLRCVFASLWGSVRPFVAPSIMSDFS